MIPAETENLFRATFLFNFDLSDENCWVMDYYVDVLRSKDRDTFLKYREEYVEYLINKLSNGLLEYTITDAYHEDYQVMIF